MQSVEARDHTSGAGADEVLLLRRFLTQCPRLCGTFSIVVGLVGVAAWWMGRPQITAIFSGLPTMTTNTAVMAVLAGTSLILLAPVTAATAKVLLGQLCAATVASIAGLTLAEHIFGRDFGIDRLLLEAMKSEVDVRVFPERPAVHAVGAFGTIAAALMTLNTRTVRGLRPAEMLALVSGTISLIALLGHLFRIAAFYGPPTEIPFIGVSVPTSFVVFALSAGILAARFDEGVLSVLVSRDSGGVAVRQLMAALVAFVPIVCVLAVATRIGALGAPTGAALVVLVAIVGGTTLFLSVSRSLSRLDAERSQVEAQLRTSQERLELALRGAEIATWDWDVASGKVIVNQRWDEMRGFGAGDLVQDVSVWNATVHPDDWPRVQTILNDHLEGRVPEYAAEHRVRTMTGAWIWILVRGRVSARDEQGRPIRMVGTALDITSRKRFEEEQAFLAEAGTILASSLEYEDTLNHIARFAAREFADLCVVNLVEEGGMQRLKTFTRDPSKAWISELLMRIRIDPTRSELISTILETKRPILMETVPQKQIDAWSQTEEYRQVLEVIPIGSIIGAPLLAHGKAVGIIWLVRSTASTPYAPPDLRLAEALAERAALAIENARLYRAAQRAIEARDSLMGVVAHDLRNPLGSILMQAAMLRRKEDQTERRSRKPVESIERGAKRMNRLIQDLLDITSIEAGRLSIQQARVDPGRQVSEVVEAQRPLADAASLTIEAYVEPDLPEVWADRERLLQVFENLIGNAIKFTKPGGRIDVGATRGQDEVLFRVSDTGGGIEASSLPHLFERFWQGPGSRHTGAGLGLPIVKGIVEAHQGRIWAESEPGHGSTFFFTIPAAPPSQDGPPRQDLVRHEASSVDRH